MVGHVVEEFLRAGCWTPTGLASVSHTKDVFFGLTWLEEPGRQHCSVFEGKNT